MSDLEVATDRALVGAMSWSDSVDIDFRLDDYVSRAEVLSALEYIQFTGGLTNTAAALSALRTQMFWTSSRPGAILPGSIVITIFKRRETFKHYSVLGVVVSKRLNVVK